MSRTRILYVQHAATASGSAVSLGILLRGLDRERYEPILACLHPTPEIRNYYADIDVPLIPVRGIREFPHTTGGWLRLWNPLDLTRLLVTVASLPRSIRAMERLLDEQRPDLIHLNSLVLAPAAIAAHRRGVPLVWHVREHASDGHLGLRRRYLARLVKKLPDAAIFLSRADMLRLGNQSSWSVIPNAVSTTRPIDRSSARRQLGIPDDSKVVLFLGGYSLLKGVLTLLESLPHVSSAVPKLRCLLVGAHAPSETLGPRLARILLPKLGLSTPRQKVEQSLADVRTHVVVLPWRPEVAPLFAASDVLVFPALEAHFPRPVIEAITQGVPVVASDLDGIREAAGEGCRLVPPGDATALSRALIEVLTNTEEAQAEAATAAAEAGARYDPAVHVHAVEAVYERVLAEAARDRAT